MAKKQSTPKKQHIKVFISYRNREPSLSEAEKLAAFLQSQGFDVFIDKTELRGGDIWEQKIYDNVRDSDVLVVLLQSGNKTNDKSKANEKDEQDKADEESTARSEWVQREVDIARGCHISILPLKISGQNIDIVQVQELLAIRDRQFQEYGSLEYTRTEIEKRTEDQLEKKKGNLSKEDFASVKNDSDAKLKQELENAETLVAEREKKLVTAIEILSQTTRLNQRDWMKSLSRRRRTNPASQNANYANHDLDNGVTLHLATGDITELSGIDVLVNSENDYMQMARIFESHTLSSALRIKGARMEHGRLLEDRVQAELNEQLSHRYGPCGLPVMIGQVIPTHAGHQQSVLVNEKKVRYIFHAATMRFDAISSRERLLPIETDRGLQNMVNQCFQTFKEVNEKKGQILHDESAFKDSQPTTEAFKPIQSIAIPLFGTGHGGRLVSQVIPPILQAIQTCVQAEVEHLTDVYVSVYSETDVEVVQQAMQEKFDSK